MEAFLNATHQSSDEDKSKARWSISSSALYLLEQVFKMSAFRRSICGSALPLTSG